MGGGGQGHTCIRQMDIVGFFLFFKLKKITYSFILSCIPIWDSETKSLTDTT